MELVQGSGFVLSNFLGIQGKIFDVDAFKKSIVAKSPESIDAEWKKFAGKSLKDTNLENPEDVSMLHAFVKERGYYKHSVINFLLAHKDTPNKPNVIFDVTLKDLDKLQELSNWVTKYGGYSPANIHIVWIANSFNVAVAQNNARERKVSGEIMVQTHTGASLTMKALIQKTNEYRKYADGTIWAFFNQAMVDNVLTKTGNKKNEFIVDRYTAILLKDKGKPATPYDQIQSQIIDKINSYVPAGARW